MEQRQAALGSARQHRIQERQAAQGDMYSKTMVAFTVRKPLVAMRTAEALSRLLAPSPTLSSLSRPCQVRKALVSMGATEADVAAAVASAEMRFEQLLVTCAAPMRHGGAPL